MSEEGAKLRGSEDSQRSDLCGPRPGGCVPEPDEGSVREAVQKGVKRILGVATLNRKEPFSLDMILA
jgi:hypothetical protein